MAFSSCSLMRSTWLKSMAADSAWPGAPGPLMANGTSGRWTSYGVRLGLSVRLGRQSSCCGTASRALNEVGGGLPRLVPTVWFTGSDMYMKFGMTSRPVLALTSFQWARLNGPGSVRPSQSAKYGLPSGDGPWGDEPVVNSSARHVSKYWM